MNRIKGAWRYGVILLGSMVLAFGLFNVHSRTMITEGGVLGAMLLVEHWLHISPSITGAIMDSLCYLIGFKVLGGSFAKYSIVATAGFAASYALFERIGPILPDLSPWPLAAALAGGLFVGVGCGTIVRIGGAAGGDDALAMSISKLAKWPISRAYMLTDFVVLTLSLSYIPLGKIVWSLISVMTSSMTIELLQRIGRKKAAAKPAEESSAPCDIAVTQDSVSFEQTPTIPPS